MGHEPVLLILALVCGFYMAWNIGANDVANAMGTSVGSGALTLRRAVILASFFEFAGAFLVGSHVSETVRKGIFDPTLLPPHTLACGMIAALLAAGVWLQVASYFGWPVSTTHAIVGAVVGFGTVALGASEIEWAKVFWIAGSWVLSPILAGAISYVVFRLVLHRVFFRKNPVKAAKETVPYLAFLVVFVLIGATGVKGLAPYWQRIHWKPMDAGPLLITLTSGIVVGIGAYLVARHLVQRIPTPVLDGPHHLLTTYISRGLDKAGMHLRRVQNTADGNLQERAAQLLAEVEDLSREARQRVETSASGAEYREVERIFAYLQIMSACFVAFAHGSNDVANAIGPFSAAFQAIHQGTVAFQASVPSWVLALGGVGIVVGLATWGWRVIETVGKRITELTPTRGFCAEFGAAITILFASVAGIPISTTHTLVGAVLGVGAARGLGALNLGIMRDIVASWIITIPAGALLTVVFYFLLAAIV